MGNTSYTREITFINADKKSGIAVFTNPTGKYEFVYMKKTEKTQIEVFSETPINTSNINDYITRTVCGGNENETAMQNLQKCKNPQTAEMILTVRNSN